MDPFAQGFDERFFYPSSAHTEALARLEYAVRSGLPFALLTGELGSGKTFVWRMLVSRVPRDGRAFLAFPSPPRAFDEIAAQVLRTLGRSPERSGSWRALERALSSLSRTRRALVLVLDEAQELSRRLLLEMRNMTNLSPGALSFILVGQPELRVKVRSLSALDSRVGLRYHLRCLTHKDVALYVRHRLAVSGAGMEFDDPSCAALAAAGPGSPREINFLAALALASARAVGRNVVTREDVEAVADDASRQAG